MQPHAVSGGIRSVRPYYFDYATPFKQRWLHRTVLLVLCTELGQLQEIVERGIDSGNIFVSTNNGRALPKEAITGDKVRVHLLQPHDVIHNRQHTHEPDIKVGNFEQGLRVRSSSEDSPIIYENEGILVVHKPAGVPTHPGGTYRYNSVSEMLREYAGPVWPCHRLDKATLGVLVFAKTKAHCLQYMALIGQKAEVKKYYLARVKGQFPGLPFRYRFPVFSINSSGGYAQNLSVPTDSTTLFCRVQYFPGAQESVVLCRPITGKMHQIRIHLRNLGFPIANDGFYNDTEEVNTMKSAIERNVQDRISEEGLGVREIGARGNYVTLESYAAPQEASHARNSMSLFEQVLADCMQALGGPVPHLEPQTIDLREHVSLVQEQLAVVAELREKKDKPSEAPCAECARPLYKTAPDTGIFLHALMLTSTHFQFYAKYPDWAVSPETDESQPRHHAG